MPRSAHQMPTRLPRLPGYYGHGGGPWKLREGMVDIAPVVLPTTDAELVAQGWPSVGAGDLWLCDEAVGNLIGKVNGLQWGPSDGPLQGRRFQGLPFGGTLAGKVGVEYYGTAGVRPRFVATNAADLSVGAGNFTISLLVRTQADWRTPAGWSVNLLSKITAAAVGYRFVCDNANVAVHIDDGAGGAGSVSTAVNLWDGAIHLVTVSVNRAGNISFYIDDRATASGACPAAGSLDVAIAAQMGSFAWWDTYFTGQYAWVYHCVGTAASRVGHDALYSRMVQWSYPTDLFTTKTRTGRITVPIGYQPGVGQLVATYGAGQPAHGFAMGPKQSQSALLAGTALPLDWRQAVTQNAPTQRGGAGMCYDSLRKQIILFGGYDGTRRDDTWIFDLASQEWQQVSSGGPAGRSNMMLVYDPVRDRAVMFGGNTGVASAQTYEFDPAVRQWTLAAPVASPTARFDYAATYDTARSRVLIFGGVDAGAVLLRETYEYDGLTWTLVSNVGPTARRGSAIAYDASQGLTLLFSGLDGLGYNQETWSWNGATATWANLAPAAQPSGRAYHVGWYDSVRQTCYVAFGTNGVVEYNDTWSYSWAGNTWTQTSTSAATGTRFYTEGAFDDYHGVYALFGGLMGATFFADTWTYARGPVGLAAAARLVFEPIGSNDFYGNATVAGLCAKSSVDGSSGMRDGLRATMGGAYNPLGNRLYFPAAGVAIAGASNVSWRYDLMYRRATVGNSARASIYFSGDPAGAESFNTLTDDLTPTEWVKGGAACLPVGSAHTLCFPACGAANNLDNCDFAEPTLIKNTDQPAPYYLRTGTAAAETVAAQTTTIAGAVGKYAPPAKGHLLFNLLGAPGATERMGEIVGTIWRSLPNVLGSIAGSLWVRCAPDVQLRVLDTNGYEVATVRTGYVPRAGEALDVDAVWDAATALPVLSAIGTDRLALMLNGTFGVSGASAAWVPAAKASISSVKMAHDN